MNSKKWINLEGGYHVDSGHYKHSVRTLEATELYYAIVDCTTYGLISSLNVPCDVSIFVYC